jgi:hypothetical protein
MRPLHPDERAEILARNPRATDADVAAYDELLGERMRLAASIAGRERGRELSEVERAARLAAVERALDELATRVLPRWDEAMAAVAARAVAEDDAPPVG